MTKNTRILVHGASVTQQKGESSYVDRLVRLLDRAAPGCFDVVRRGYGGCHFGDAGFLTLGSDLSDGFRYCLLDWNTTGQSEFEDVKFQHVLAELQISGVTPIFLILARTDTIERNRDSENQVEYWCKSYGIPLLDLRSSVRSDIHLRDTVHTNEAGAEVYARMIAHHLITDQFTSFKWPDNRHSRLRISSARGLLLDIREGKILRIKVAAAQIDAQLVFEIILGPASPIIYAGPNRERTCIWDRWCHYERPGFVVACRKLPMGDEIDIDVEVVSESIDYSGCARPFDFDGEKILKIRSIYGVGCDIGDVQVISLPT